MRGIVAEVSGGFDSAMSAYMAASTGRPVHPLFVDYDQPYAPQELQAAKYVVDHLKQFPNVNDLEVRYTDIALRSPPGSVSEYVPIRNLVLCSLSANYAQSVDASSVYVGSKTSEWREGDPYSFRDCTTEFYDRVSDLVALASETPDLVVKFEQPLIINGLPSTKHQVMRGLFELGVNLENLWTCYSDSPFPCKACYHCRVADECVRSDAGLLEAYAGVWGPA